MSVFDKNFIVKRTWRSTTQSKLYKLSNKGKVSFSERLHLTTVAGKGVLSTYTLVKILSFVQIQF